MNRLSEGSARQPFKAPRGGTKSSRLSFAFAQVRTLRTPSWAGVRHVYGSIRVLAFCYFFAGCTLSLPSEPIAGPVEVGSRIEQFKADADDAIREMERIRIEVEERVVRSINECPKSKIGDVWERIHTAEEFRRDLRKETDLDNSILLCGHIFAIRSDARKIRNDCGILTTEAVLPRRQSSLVAFSATAMSLGIAGALAGAIFGALALDNRNELDARCPNKQCQLQDKPVADAATVFGNVSTVAFVLGGLGLSTGTFGTLFYFSTNPKTSPSAMVMTVHGNF